MLIKSCKREINRRVFRGFDVPADIDAVTDIDPAEVHDEELTGLTREEISSICDDLRDLFSSGMHPMVSICLRRHGQMVLNRSIGYAELGDEHTEHRVASLDTPVCLFSSSKAITAMLIHKLAEEGKLDLLAPVSYYIPEFAAKGKANINIYQLLGHRAGVPGVPGVGEEVPIEVLYDPEAALKHICESETLHAEGRVPAYHAITGGFVLAELVRVVTGKNIRDYHEEVFRKPLDMKYFTFGLNKRYWPKVAKHYASGLPTGPVIGGVLSRALGASVDEVTDISNCDDFLGALIPSGNMYATAEEASRFFQMMLDHGKWQGRQLMEPLTIHRATQEMGGVILDKSLYVPMRYSPGMMLGGKPAGLYGRNTHYAYGHLGFSNILCWADPERDIAVSITSTGKPVIGSHILALLKLVDGISSRCQPCVDMLRDEPHFHRLTQA